MISDLTNLVHHTMSTTSHHNSIDDTRNDHTDTSATTDEPVPVPLLLRLPPELIDYLLSHIPPQLLQRTAVALLSVFPDSPISNRYLWKHLVVGNPKQLKPLWTRLAHEEKRVDPPGGVTQGIETFCMVSCVSCGGNQLGTELILAGIVERRCRSVEQVGRVLEAIGGYAD
jgi:hypothetical protein